MDRRPRMKAGAAKARKIIRIMTRKMMNINGHLLRLHLSASAVDARVNMD